MTATTSNGINASFSITGNEIRVTASTGLLFFLSPPDYETKSLYTATVTASDSTNSSTQDITIKIRDLEENEHSPVITSANEYSVDENVTMVGQATATDGDGDELFFEIRSDHNLSIDSSSGVISFDIPPDYEIIRGYPTLDADLFVSDCCSTTSQYIKISINNVNDNPPVFTGSDSFGADENQTKINGTVEFEDADGDELTYALSGTDASFINIEADSGILSFSTAPDYEKDQTSYSITVTASDGVFKASKDITVAVYNRIDPLVVENQTFSVEEGNTFVGTLDFYDPDNSLRSIKAVDGDLDQLVVTFDSGDVSFRRPTDYNRPQDQNGDNIYEFSIEIATRYGADANTADITINVLDNNFFTPSLIGDVVTGSEGDFGRSLDLNADGTILVAGDPDHESSRGSVRTYIFDGSNWSQKGNTLLGPATGDGVDKWGEVVSINADGSIIAAGGPQLDYPPDYNSGAVKVYEWLDNDWSQKGADLIPNNGRYAVKERGGNSIALSDSGEIIVIGNTRYTDEGSPYGSGSVDVYEFVGDSWSLKGSKIVSTTVRRPNPEYIGAAVSVNASGNVIAYGAFGWADPYTLSGQVKVFEWDGTDWIQKGQSFDGLGLERLGSDVRLNAAGDRVLILSQYHLQVWEFASSSWKQIGSNIKPNCFNSQQISYSSIDFSNDGDYIAVAAPCDGGVVFSYAWNGSDWVSEIDNIYGTRSSVSMSSDGGKVATQKIDAISVGVYRTR